MEDPDIVLDLRTRDRNLNKMFSEKNVETFCRKKLGQLYMIGDMIK